MIPRFLSFRQWVPLTETRRFSDRFALLPGMADAGVFARRPGMVGLDIEACLNRLLEPTAAGKVAVVMCYLPSFSPFPFTAFSSARRASSSSMSLACSASASASIMASIS
jgi:hypothetical protein